MLVLLTTGLTACAGGSGAGREAVGLERFHTRDLTFTYPASWTRQSAPASARRVPVPVPVPFVVVSNRPQARLCASTAEPGTRGEDGYDDLTLMTCRRPTGASLGRGGVLATWDHENPGASRVMPCGEPSTLIVGGRESARWVTRTRACIPGHPAGSAEVQRVFIPGPEGAESKGYMVTVYLRGPKLERLQQQVRAMLDSVRFE